MKHLLRSFVVETFALFAVSSIASGLVFVNGIQTLFLAGVALMVGSFLVKPILNILLLPLTLVTFGLFRWISSAIILYLVTLLVTGFRVEFFNFAGYSSIWLEIPAISLTGAFSYIAFAFLISFITTFIHWLFK